MNIVKAFAVTLAAVGFAVSASCGSASAPAETPSVPSVEMNSGK